LGLDLVAERLLGFGPVAIERRDEFVALGLRPVGPFPRCAARAAGHVGGAVLEAREEGLPLGIDRLGVGLVAGVEVLDVGGVGPVEKRRESEGRVGVLAGHVQSWLEGNREEVPRLTAEMVVAARPGGRIRYKPYLGRPRGPNNYLNVVCGSKITKRANRGS